MTTKIPAELSSTPGISDSSDATAITIDSSERVGILQGSPTSNLHIGASGNDAKRELRIDGTNGSGQTYGCIIEADGENGRFVFKVGQSGNTPAQQFMVHPDGGICFGTDTAAANALHDYEEGTWTPTDASGASLSFTVDKNRYTKIGRFVMAHTRITYPSTSNGSTATVALPFTPNSNCIGSVAGGICTEQDFDTSVAVTASIDGTAGTRFRSNGGGALTNAQLSGKTVRFTVTFITD